MSKLGGDALLAGVLLINGTISGLVGLIVFLVPTQIDELMGAGSPGIVRLVGAGLVLFGIAVFALGRQTGPVLRSGGRVVLVLDIIWVVASVVLVASGWFSTSGKVIVLAVALVVAGFALGEVVGLQRSAVALTRPSASGSG